MEAVAIIPARGGSKGVPRKNVRLLCGKPLIVWTIEAALQAPTVGRVVVSTDDDEIGDVALRHGAEVVERPAQLSGDDSPSEAALLHALDHLRIDDGALAFLQCTSPLMLPADIDGTLHKLKQWDSAFTATPSYTFDWDSSPSGATPVGHSKTHRPMRQQRAARYTEVGAVYALRVNDFRRERRRFVGTTAIHPLPRERAIEIDDEHEFFLAEALLHRRLQRQRRSALPAKLEAIVFDFDGVFTDNRVVVHESGAEAVTCHRGDGWALQRLKEMGVKLLVLTNESNPVARRRCEKLQIECIATQGRKLPFLQTWLRRKGVQPRNVCFVGNDEPDVECMQFVGCGIAPADAYPEAKQASRVVLNAKGGHGCIRELVALLQGE